MKGKKAREIKDSVCDCRHCGRWKSDSTYLFWSELYDFGSDLRSEIREHKGAQLSNEEPKSPKNQ